MADRKQIEAVFVVISEDCTPSPLAHEIAESQLASVIQIENRDDSFFEFFRNTAEQLFFPMTYEMLYIGDTDISCQRLPLILDPTHVELMPVCRCHHVPVLQKTSYQCSVSGKHASQTSYEYSIGEAIAPFIPEGNQKKGFTALCRIKSAKISESFLFGTTLLLQSESPKFHRLINELRCHKEAVITKKSPTRILGGEFWLLVADSVSPVVHCKRIANRTQILRFESGSNSPSGDGVWTAPIITCLTEIDEFNPFILGSSELSQTFGLQQ
jgi:hypothetical protein